MMEGLVGIPSFFDFRNFGLAKLSYIDADRSVIPGWIVDVDEALAPCNLARLV